MAAQIVEKALEELDTNMTLLDLGNKIIDSLIIFSIVFLFAIIFDFSAFYALIPTAIYFFFSIGFIFFKNKYLIVEKKVPELNEQLRTVADNIHRTNPIIDSLKEDVTKNVSKVKTNSFIDYNLVVIKILFITTVSILIVIASFLNVSFDFAFGSLPFENILGIRAAGQNVTDLNLSYKEGNLSEILGNGSVARLGSEELRLTINPLESEADVNNIRQVSEGDFNPPAFPKEIYTSYDVAYNEKINKENQRVVKNYFEQITR